MRLQAVGETNEEGDVRVFFELNGQPRTVRVPNRKAQASAPKRPKAEVGNADHVAAPMPGVIASVAVAAGQPVKAGDLMLTIEAMKMETGLYADRAGTVRARARRSPGRRSTRRTCWWRSPRPDATGPRATWRNGAT